MELLASELARQPLFVELETPVHLRRALAETLTAPWVATQGYSAGLIQELGAPSARALDPLAQPGAK
eukprot:4688001-Pyramimonas_sp.AAC.1